MQARSSVAGQQSPRSKLPSSPALRGRVSPLFVCWHSAQVVQTGSMSVTASGGMTALGPGIAFLGSWAGDSLLLRYSLQVAGSSAPAAGAKRPRTGVDHAGAAEDDDGEGGLEGEEEGEGLAAPHIAAKGAYLDPSRPVSNEQPSKYDFTVSRTSQSMNLCRDSRVLWTDCEYVREVSCATGSRCDGTCLMVARLLLDWMGRKNWRDMSVPQHTLMTAGCSTGFS